MLPEDGSISRGVTERRGSQEVTPVGAAGLKSHEFALLLPRWVGGHFGEKLWGGGRQPASTTGSSSPRPPTILDSYLHFPILLPAPHLSVERVLQTGGASEKHRRSDFSKFHSIQIFEKIAVFDLKTYPWHDILMIVG